MTTITLDNDILLSKTNFRDISDLLEYIIKQEGINFNKLDESDITRKILIKADECRLKKESEFINI